MSLSKNRLSGRLQKKTLSLSRCGSRAAATSKMERFVIIVNGFELLQELYSDATVKEVLEFDDCAETFELVVNALSVDWRQELKATCIHSVINPNGESDFFDLEEHVDDAMEINLKPAVNWQPLTMLDKSTFLWRKWCRKRSLTKCCFVDKKSRQNLNRIQETKTISDFFK